MNVKYSANSVKVKARKRLDQPPPEYFSKPDYSKPVRRLIYEDLITGTRHEFEMFISRRRVDQFVVNVDGKPWLEQAGWSRILAGLRKAVPRFSQARP